MFKAVTRCRICGCEDLAPVLNLGVQSLTGIFPASAEEPVPQCPLELVKCLGGCGLVQLKHTCELRRLYSPRYGYRSGLQPSMVRHLEAIVARLEDFVPLEPGDLIVDIGSNDGTLLRSWPQGKFQLMGIDPILEKFEGDYPPEISKAAEFFTADLVRKHFPGRKAKVVTAIAMFYDVESPLDFLSQVCEVLADDGVFVFEQSYLPFLLSRNAYDTVCHEHLSYYALSQIVWMAERAGLKIVNVSLNAVNGGSFIVTAARAASPYPEGRDVLRRLLEAESLQGLDQPFLYQRFESAVRRHRDALRDVVGQWARRGRRAVGYGASTKGNVVLQYCGMTPDDLLCVAEINPEKFGCFCPGSRIPIVPQDKALEMDPDVLLVLPWHLRDDIIAREQSFLRAGGEMLFSLPEMEFFKFRPSVRRQPLGV